MKKLSLVIVLVFAIAAGFAQTSFTATYTFGSDGNVQSFAFNGTQPPGVTMGNIVKIGINSTSSSNNFRGDNWPLASAQSPGIDLNKYIGFTMSSNSGYMFSVTKVNFGIGRSGTGTRKTEWRGSGNDFASTINNYTTLNSNLTNSNGVLGNPDLNSSWKGNVLSLTGVSGYQNLLFCDLRMYMYDTEASDGTAGLQDPITIEGTYQPVGSNVLFNVYPKSLSGFTYKEGNCSTIVKNFTMVGYNLSGSVSVVAPSHYEVATAAAGPYTASLNVPVDGNGNVQQNVYVRLIEGLTVGEYNNEIVMITPSTPGFAFSVTCSGSVIHARYWVDFEGPGETKGGYASGTVNLSGLDWDMTEALIGTSTSDYRIGARSARLQGTASMTMLEFKTEGGGTVSFRHRRYGTESDTYWKVEYSTDAHGAVGGETWHSVGTFTAGSTEGTFSMNINNSKSIRLRISANGNNGTKRANIDNIEITDYYDFFKGVATQGNSENTITFTGGHASYSLINTTPGDPPDPAFQVSFHRCLTLLGPGPWTISVSNDTADWAAYKQGGTWYSTAFANGSATLQVTAAKNQEIELLTGSGNDPALPVTLSHFSATMTAENYVQLTWVSQTETNALGYNVFRSDSDNLDSAMQISPLIAATNTSFAQTYVYVDKELMENGTYYYWLQNVDMDGTFAFHGPVSVVFSISGDTGAPGIPTATKLDNAYPNPFNPNTTIRYQLKDAGKVKIEIFNLKGQVLRSFEKGHDAAGHYGIVWDGRDSSGKELSSGVYLYKMSSGGYSETKKVVLQK